MKERLNKFIASILILTITLSWTMCIFYNPVYAKESESTPRTGHTQQEAGETIAAWAIHFRELHENQIVYSTDFSSNAPRTRTYNLPVSDTDFDTLYTTDCNGFVSFVVHHALGIGPDYFVRFVDRTGTGDDDSFEIVGYSFEICQPGDLLVFGRHMAIYAGDGLSIGVYGDQNIWYGPAEQDAANTGGLNFVARIRPEVAASVKFAYLEGAGSAVSGFSMTGTKVSDCAHNELGGASGGEPGDQTSDEYSVKEWYDFGQTFVLRYPDEKVAEAIAKISIKAANNDAIGYCQPDRLTYWGQLENANYEPEKVSVNCEADCSSSTSANIKAAGHLLNIDKLKNFEEDSYTMNIRERLEAVGFTTLTDAKYLNGPDELLAGDIILDEGHHVNVFVGNGMQGGGSGGGTANFEIDPITVNLDELIFSFAGSPKTVMYSGSNNLGEWLFTLFGQFADYLVGVIISGICKSLLGYVVAGQGAVHSAIIYLDGEE